jgi:hypothetical protein
MKLTGGGLGAFGDLKSHKPLRQSGYMRVNNSKSKPPKSPRWPAEETRTTLGLKHLNPEDTDTSINSGVNCQTLRDGSACQRSATARNRSYDC